jgi:hypothetical protein
MKTGENETPEEDCTLSFISPNGASIDQLDAHHFLGGLTEMNGSCTLNLHFKQCIQCYFLRRVSKFEIGHYCRIIHLASAWARRDLSGSYSGILLG